MSILRSYIPLRPGPLSSFSVLSLPPTVLGIGSPALYIPTRQAGHVPWSHSFSSAARTDLTVSFASWRGKSVYTISPLQSQQERSSASVSGACLFPKADLGLNHITCISFGSSAHCKHFRKDPWRCGLHDRVVLCSFPRLPLKLSQWVGPQQDDLRRTSQQAGRAAPGGSRSTWMRLYTGSVRVTVAASGSP